MEDSIGLTLINIIQLIRSSERHFKEGKYKVALKEKKEVKSLLQSWSENDEIVQKFKEELSRLYSSKFDLIYDHKLRISKRKKNDLIKLLEEKSNEKYKIGDYKGALKALRRSEKYFF